MRRALWVAALFVVGSCGWSGGGDSARLRVANVGNGVIKSLTVLFPEDRVTFGDIAAGETSAYREVPHGVYSYAAYNFQTDEGLVTQPVIDWVGEEPMEGESFTYSLAVGAHGVDLVRVTREN